MYEHLSEAEDEMDLDPEVLHQHQHQLGGSSEAEATSTIISVKFDEKKKVQVIPFEAKDASFPDLGRSIDEMLSSPSGQPHILLFAQPAFPLLDLINRLEVLFNHRCIIGAYSRCVSGK